MVIYTVVIHLINCGYSFLGFYLILLAKYERTLVISYSIYVRAQGKRVKRFFPGKSLKSITESPIKISSVILDIKETKNILFFIVFEYYVNNHMYLQKHSTTHLILILLNIYFTLIIIIM